MLHGLTYPMAKQTAYEEGDRVEIHGLTHETVRHLNGKEGTILKDKIPGFHRVKIDSGEKLDTRPKHLRPIRILKIGVLALQGAFAEHMSMLNKLGADAVEVRNPTELVRETNAEPVVQNCLLILAIRKL